MASTDREQRSTSPSQVFLRIYAHLFARPRAYRLNRYLLNIAWRGLGILNHDSDYLRGESGFLKRLFQSQPLDPPPVVLDIGAHIGDYSDLVLTWEPNAAIYAFEPHPISYAKLNKRFHSQNVRCFNFAISATSGSALLHDYADHDGSSHATLLEEVFSAIHDAQSTTYKVPTVSLTEFLDQRSIDHIFLIKIDVEGSELSVLNSLEAFLRRDSSRVDHIQIEFNEMNVISRTFLADFIERLEQYEVFRILPGGTLMGLSGERPMYRELFAYQNLVFKRTGYVKPKPRE